MAIEDLERQRLAQRAMHRLARAGNLTKPERCELCWRLGLDLHWWFGDYRYPLASVMWICQGCRHRTRERIKTMATFASWLSVQENRPEDDPTGWLARAWKAQEGSRPRVSSPGGIGRHLHEVHPELAEAVDQALIAATHEYTQQRAREQAGDSSTSSQPAAGQQAMPGMEPAGQDEQTGKPVAVVPSSAWVQHPDATKFGTCAECGWPRGLAGSPAGAMGTHITCAAGHVFKPVQPQAADQATYHVVVPTSITTSGGAGSVRGPQQAEDAAEQTEHEQNVQRLAAMGPQTGPATGQDRRYQGASPAEIAAAERAAGGAVPLDQEQLSDHAMLAALTEWAQHITGAIDALSTQQELLIRLLLGEPAASPPEPGSGADGGPAAPWEPLTLSEQLASPGHAGDAAEPQGGAERALGGADGWAGAGFASWFGAADDSALAEPDAGWPPQSHG